MSFASVATPVGKNDMPTRLTALVFGSIRQSAPSRGVVAQTALAPAATSQTPAVAFLTGSQTLRGPSLVIVKSGTATFYEADDATCSPQRLVAGQGFIDNGHDTHVVRNEGNVDLVTVVVSLVAAGFSRRIDEPAPGNCPQLPNG